MYTKVSLFAIAVLLMALIALVPTLQFPSSEDVSTFIGPRLWPLTLLIILLGLGGFLLISTQRQARRSIPVDETITAIQAESVSNKATTDQAQGTDRADPDIEHAESIKPTGWAATRHWWLMAATLAYTLLMPVTGFLIATLLFTLFTTWLLGARHWAAIITTLAVAALMIQGVFAYLLGIPLP